MLIMANEKQNIGKVLARIYLTLNREYLLNQEVEGMALMGHLEDVAI